MLSNDACLSARGKRLSGDWTLASNQVRPSPKLTHREGSIAAFAIEWSDIDRINRHNCNGQ